MTQIKKKKLFEEVIVGIEEMLKSNNMKPGDRLQSEKELSLYFGVSKTAVREALSALQSAGLIEVKHGSGIFVRNVNEQLTHPLKLKLLANRDSILQILEIRKSLECEGAFLAAQRADTSDIARLKNCLLEMAKLIERKEQDFCADHQFHTALIAATHNLAYSNTNDVVAEVFYEAVRSLPNHLNDMSALNLLEEHRLIYESIKKRQPERACDLMRKYFDKIEVDLRKSLPPV